MHNNLPWNYAMRGFAVLHVAIYDAMVAAWDSKYAYNRKRPSEIYGSLATALPNPRSPSYPAEHAVAAGARRRSCPSCFRIVPRTLRTRRKRRAERACSRVSNIRVTSAPGSDARSLRT
jgi:hypothetical protein